MSNTNILMAPAKNSQTSLTHGGSSSGTQHIGKSEVGRLLPRSVDQWLSVNKQLWLAAKVALSPPSDASDIEKRAFVAFGKWLRFHKPPFDRRDTQPWIDKAKSIKTPQIVS